MTVQCESCPFKKLRATLRVRNFSGISIGNRLDSLFQSSKILLLVFLAVSEKAIDEKAANRLDATPACSLWAIFHLPETTHVVNVMRSAGHMNAFLHRQILIPCLACLGVGIASLPCSASDTATSAKSAGTTSHTSKAAQPGYTDTAAGGVRGWTPGGPTGRVGSPYYWSQSGAPAYYPGAAYAADGFGGGYGYGAPVGAAYGGGAYGSPDPYTHHFGPGYYRSAEYGHYRFPYYSYRRPWYHPGPATYSRDTNYPW